MSLFNPLADAVVALLNAQTFSQQFTATRVYDSTRALETLGTLRVDVILGDRKSTPLDRSRQKDDIRVEVAVRQVVSRSAGLTEETAILDGLVALVEELDAFLSARANRRPPGAEWAGWQGSELVYPFLPAHVRDNRQFTSLLRLSYFVVRDP